VSRVEEFVYNMLINVFNAKGTADLALELIHQVGGYDPGPKADRIEDPAQWTPAKMTERAKSLSADKGEKGYFDD